MRNFEQPRKLRARERKRNKNRHPLALFFFSRGIRATDYSEFVSMFHCVCLETAGSLFCEWAFFPSTTLKVFKGGN